MNCVLVIPVSCRTSFLPDRATHLMTEPESPESLSDESGAAVSAPVDETEASEPAPEPWTPARVSEWNAYYDLYVALGVVLLVFVNAANKITHSPLWGQLEAGRTMAAQRA